MRLDLPDTFFADARSAFPSAPYEYGRRLGAIFARAHVLETRDHRFNPAGYAAEGHCERRDVVRPHAERVARWEGVGAPPGDELYQGWCRYAWQGRDFGVLAWRDADDCGAFVVGEGRAEVEAFFSAVCAWSADVRPEREILVFEGGSWMRTAALRAAIARASLDDLVLPEALVSGLVADFDRFWGSAEAYDRHGVPWRRGLILAGPPGNGKTHLIKALVNRSRRPCLYVRSVRSRCATEEGSLARVFGRARERAPCILVFEDLDALVHDTNRSFFLNELDGFADNRGVFTLATTNHPEALDPAIAERPSRFDRVHYVPPPDAASRLAYLARWAGALEPALRPPPPALEALAEQTEGFSYAYLKELGISALSRWIAEGSPPSAFGALVEHAAAELRAALGRRRP
jgi:hypothetical protein